MKKHIIILSAGLMAGCGSTAPAKQAANVTHDVGIAGADVLRTVCVEPMERATTEAEIARINALGCRDAVRAYDGMRDAHALLVAVIKATDAAQCVGVSKASRDCNVAGAYVELSKAAAEWAEAVKRIQDASAPTTAPPPKPSSFLESRYDEAVSFVEWRQP